MFQQDAAGCTPCRNKLTKLASNKDGKRMISTQLHALMAVSWGSSQCTIT
jgi:hypothetical protein